MRILVIGGTGLISGEVVQQAVRAGHDVTVVNRGRTDAELPASVHVWHADATNPAEIRGLLRGMRLRQERFDAVLQAVCFNAEHVLQDLETFAPVTDQYVLIATAAAYVKREHFQLLTEDVPLGNPYWPYAQAKADAEVALREAAPSHGLNYTIVRPAHTYGKNRIPAYAGNSAHPWTIVDRMRRGAEIIVPGDGTALWTTTHARDVAAGIVGLLGNRAAYGQAVHITNDLPLTWLGLYRTIARAAGLSDDQFDQQCIFVPSAAMVEASPSWAGGIYGDKMHCAVYDNSRIKTLVPGFLARTSLESGMTEAIAWFEEDPVRQTVDADSNALFDDLARRYRQ